MFAVKVDPNGTVSDTTWNAVPDMVKVADETTWRRFADAVRAELGDGAASVPVGDDVVMILRLTEDPGDLNRVAARVAHTLDAESAPVQPDDVTRMIAALFGPDAVSAVSVESDPVPVYGPVLFVGSLGDGPASLSTRRADQIRAIGRGVTADAS